MTAKKFEELVHTQEIARKALDEAIKSGDWTISQGDLEPHLKKIVKEVLTKAKAITKDIDPKKRVDMSPGVSTSAAAIEYVVPGAKDKKPK